MKILTLLAAEVATTDQATNRLSLFNVAEEISAAGFPVLAPPLTFVAMMLRKESEKEKGELKLSGTMGKQKIFELPFAYNFQGKLRLRTLANLQGLVIPKAGVLDIDISRGKTVLGTWPISVLQVGAPQLAPAVKQTSTAQIKKKKKL